MHYGVLLVAVLAAHIKISSAQQTLSNEEPHSNAEPWIPTLRCGQAFHPVKCPTGMCCSASGYCGLGPAHCSVPGNCQKGYGWCDSDSGPSGASVYNDKAKYNENIADIIVRCTKAKTLALTFDDGPCNNTNSVLDVLKAHNARATFFLGGNINGHGQLDTHWAPVVRRMIEEGHQVGSHTWSHPALDDLTPAERKTDMQKNERAIANVIGKIPTFMRPPRGLCNQTCEKEMNHLGYHVAKWEYDSRDSMTPAQSVEEIADKNLIPAMDRVNPDGNMFIIQHDLNNDASKVVDAVLKHMHDTKSGWEAVPLVECAGHDIDDAYRFPKYLEYNGAAVDGCLVSGPGMCVQATPFRNQDACFDAADHIDAVWKQCETAPGPPKAHCLQAEKLAGDLHKYCRECGDKDKAFCDWDLFKSISE